MRFREKQRSLPDEGPCDGQDGSDEPRRMNNDEGFQILPESADDMKEQVSECERGRMVRW